MSLTRTPGREQRRALDHVGRLTKRVFDIVVAGALLLILLPMLLTIALIVRIDSPGPAFFRCDRVGYRGRRLRMIKFRKMHDNAFGLRLTTSDDQRSTGIGRWLAKTKRSSWLDLRVVFWSVVA